MVAVVDSEVVAVAVVAVAVDLEAAAVAEVVAEDVVICETGSLLSLGFFSPLY